MKANELRIGNWVQIDDLPPEQVTLELLKTLAEHPGTISKFNDIPITPDWLERFGFNKEQTGSLLNGPDFYLLSDGLFICITPANGGGDFGVKCEFVHQLQNLYFALTGTELTLKP